MKRTIVNMAGALLIMFILFVIVTGWLIESENTIATLKTEISSMKENPPIETITLNEDFTLIRTSDDYIYLSSLTINRDIWEGATKQTDINGVTWYEIMQDGYIKVYAEGHIKPHEVHWYAAY
jgi:hypothetical protein